MQIQFLVTAAILSFASAARSLRAQHVDSLPERARVTELQRQSPRRLRGDQIVMLSVEYAPGAISPRHSHPGPTLVYIVEGTICSEVKETSAKLYSAGDSFYEPEGGWHAARNQSGRTVRLIAYITAPAGAALSSAVDHATMANSMAPTCH